MSKLIIWVSGRPTLDGYAKREFKWSAVHTAFIYEGREYTDSEFNAAFEKAYRNNEDLRPQVRVVEMTGYAPAAPPPTTPPPPVSTITAHEITADEAEDVLARLRPGRLKKRTGPKPMMEVA